MKSIQVTRRFVRHEWGGVETAVLETARCLHRMEMETSVATSAALSQPGVESIGGVDVHRFRHFYPYLGLSKDSRYAMDQKGGNLVSLAMLRHFQTADGLNLLHTHTLNRVGGLVRYVAKQRRIPYVVSIHGGVHDIPAEQMRRLLEPTQNALDWGKVFGWWFGARKVLADADLVICYGQRELELTNEQYPNTRVERLPHGVDLERFAAGNGTAFRQQHALAPDARVLLTLARIDPQKDQQLAVRALRRILEFEPRAVLVMMGAVTDPAYELELRREIRAQGLDQNVRLLPGVEADDPTLVDALHAADLFLLPSMHEVFGIVVLEAWAAGLPVVATDVGGLGSLIQDGDDGLLFHSGDDHTCAQRCRAVLTDEPLAARLRRAGQLRARRDFGWASVTRRLASLYEEVCHAYAA